MDLFPKSFIINFNTSNFLSHYFKHSSQLTFAAKIFNITAIANSDRACKEILTLNICHFYAKTVNT